VELYTDAGHKQATSVKDGTLEPLWAESFYVVVQVR
jgi:Ca2+-dependent lipid-binding protein